MNILILGGKGEGFLQRISVGKKKMKKYIIREKSL
jgi:hypothetical protein